MPGVVSALPIFAPQTPKEGPRYIALNYPGDFVNNLASFQISDSGMASIQSAVIDNQDNAAGIIVIVQDTGQKICVPGHTRVTTPIYTGQLYLSLNVFTPNPLVKSATVRILLFNFFQDFHEEFTGATFAFPQQFNYATATVSQTTLVHGAFNVRVLAANVTRIKYCILPDPASAATDRYDIGLGSADDSIAPTLAAFRYFGNGWLHIESKLQPEFVMTEASIFVGLTAASDRTINVSEWHL